MSVALDVLLDGGPPIEAAVIEDAALCAVAALMAEAYAGSTDDEGGTADDALDELRATARGAYGPPIRSAWLGVREGERWVSAVICTRWRGQPFVAFAFTAHGSTRRGLVSGLLRRTAQVLLVEGETDLTLFVTAENPARNLYRHLGFAELDPPVAPA